VLRNISSQKWRAYAWDATTGLPKTGDASNITGIITKDDGTPAATNDTNPTEVDSTGEKGFYAFDLTQSETDAAKVTLSCKSTTSNIVVLAIPPVVYTVPQYSSLHVIDSSGRGDISKIAGDTTAATNLKNTYAGLEAGTAQGGGSSTITLRSGASAVDNYFKDQAVFVLSGTGSGQTNRISGYVGSTRVATVETAWATQPDNTSVYLVVGRIG